MISLFTGLTVNLRNKKINGFKCNISNSKQERANILGISTMNSQIDFNDVLNEFTEITRTKFFNKSLQPATRTLLQDQPIAVERLRRLSSEKLKTAKEEIDFLLGQGIIPLSSSWASSN